MEQSAPLTLLALAAGYLFTRLFHYTVYRTERRSGYHLLFEAAGWGIALLAISQALLLASSQLPNRVVEPITRLWSAFAPIPGVAPFAVALTLALVLPALLNTIYSRDRAARRVIVRRGSEIERLLYHSINSLLPLSVTLKNEKVYIGWPVWTPEPRTPLRDVRILPAVSGFRDPQTKHLTLTTQYLAAYEQIDTGDLPVEAEDFQVVFPVDEIRSANFFSLDIDQAIFRIQPNE
jgi:hypothetical protein